MISILNRECILYRRPRTLDRPPSALSPPPSNFLGRIKLKLREAVCKVLATHEQQHQQTQACGLFLP